MSSPGSPHPSAPAASQLLVRGLRVLETVASSPGPVGVGELARQVDLPKSTVQRILVTLADEGWIQPTEDSVTRWHLTNRLLALSRHVPRQSDLRQVALPHMKALQRATQESLYLTVPDLTIGATILVEKLDSTLPVRTYAAIGAVVSMRSAATGKAILAALTDNEVDDILRLDLPAGGAAPLNDDELRRQLLEIRKSGYAVGRGEWRTGICAIAAAVLGDDGRPIAALVISIPAFRFTEDLPPRIGPMLIEATRAISRDLQ